MSAELIVLAPGQDNQPELLELPPQATSDEAKQPAEFTGQRLKIMRPQVYRALCVLLAQGLGVIRIGRLLGVSPNTVLAVRDAEGLTIDKVKEDLARVAHEGATLASEGIRDSLSKIFERQTPLDIKTLKDLAVVFGILVQNGQLLAGQATARLETEVHAPDHDAFNRYIAALPEVTITHLGGEETGTKERVGRGDSDGHGPGGDGPGPGGDGAGPGAGTDDSSVGSTTKP
jgi:hypothetical protein